jgi:hypothetical protein
MYSTGLLGRLSFRRVVVYIIPTDLELPMKEGRNSEHVFKWTYMKVHPKAGLAVVGHADANRHSLLNTRKLPVYSTCRLCQQTQTLYLLVVVQGQCTMGCAADESGMEGRFSAP